MAGKMSVGDKVKRIFSSLLHKAAANKTDDVVKSQTDTKNDNDSNGKRTQTEDVKINLRSREAFFQRIGTFSTLTWFAKPRALLPPCCARYGWENTDTDILRCTSCHAILCGKLIETNNAEKFGEHVKRLEDSLISSHQKHCSWKLNPNPESFMQLEFSDRVESLQGYLARLESVLSLGKQLPQIDTSFLEDFDTDRAFDLLGGLKKDKSESGLYIDHLIEQSTCVIALCGWTKIASSSAATVTCTFCQRQIGMWNFTDIEGQGQNQGNKESQGHLKEATSDCEQQPRLEGDWEPAQKKMKTQHIPKKVPFNPLTQHKPWCQWIVSTTEFQKSPSKTPGWRRLLLLLIPDISPGAQRPVQRIIGNIKTTPPHQGLKNIRQMFKDWSSLPKFSP
ncbi:zinc finger C3HC-type protein 1-like [Lineus longissimus]|uniref:zinc finger C3HC-type protein 1-like n=1 Tax=Lineus longissimus TaxID=88925 RepID=UPI002B4CC522